MGIKQILLDVDKGIETIPFFYEYFSENKSQRNKI